MHSLINSYIINNHLNNKLYPYSLSSINLIYSLTVHSTYRSRASSTWLPGKGLFLFVSNFLLASYDGWCVYMASGERHKGQGRCVGQRNARGARPGGQLARDIDGQRLPFGKVDRFSEVAGTAGHSAGPVFDWVGCVQPCRLCPSYVVNVMSISCPM